MAREKPKPTPTIRQFSRKDAELGRRKLNRRTEDLQKAVNGPYDNGTKEVLEQELRATVQEVFGPNSPEAADFEFREISSGAIWIGMPAEAKVINYRRGIEETIKIVQSMAKRLAEKLDDLADEPASQIASGPLSALHPKVVTVAGELFRNGHYRQAILDTYIALIEAVRTKSGSGLDGSPLMQAIFSQRAPVLSVSDDTDEQLGFMWLFSGAAMGIRNPKAHRLVDETDPQKAFEWLAFASALFRVLDEARKPI